MYLKVKQLFFYYYTAHLSVLRNSHESVLSFWKIYFFS